MKYILPLLLLIGSFAEARTAYQVLRMPSSGNIPVYGAVDISQSAAVTGTLPNARTTATDANTASAIVARDGSGNFSAGTISAALNGNASTATTATNVTTNANMTGDVTSVGNATTLATVNSNVGSFTNANITVNAKGLITAASNGSGGAGSKISKHQYVIGSAAEVTATTADYSSIATALTAHSSNTSFLITAGYSGSENLTIAGNGILFGGQGYVSTITGNIVVGTGYLHTVFKDLRVTGNVTINSTAKYANFDGVFISNTSVVTDNGTSNMINILVDE